MYCTVGYSESVRGGTKLLSDLLLSVSRFSFRGLPPARAAWEGSGLTLIVGPYAQRPLALENVSRVGFENFQALEKIS